MTTETIPTLRYRGINHSTEPGAFPHFLVEVDGSEIGVYGLELGVVYQDAAGWTAQNTRGVEAWPFDSRESAAASLWRWRRADGICDVCNVRVGLAQGGAGGDVLVRHGIIGSVCYGSDRLVPVVDADVIGSRGSAFDFDIASVNDSDLGSVTAARDAVIEAARYTTLHPTLGARRLRVALGNLDAAIAKASGCCAPAMCPNHFTDWLEFAEEI